MVRQDVKTARLDARLPKSVMDLLKMAAELQGRSLSDFVIGSAREAAERTIENNALIRLSMEDQNKFANALLRSQKPSPAMRKAAKTHAKFIDSDIKT